MEVYHLSDIHPVYMIRTEYSYQFGLMRLDKIQILEDSIGGTLKPLWTHPHLRRNKSNEMIRYYG